MTSAGPLFSVIVPAHQAAGGLEQCLEALFASDLPRDRWELIVVDDGSTDETARIAQRYADQLISLPGKPHGPSYARNRGAEVARGEWLLFIDSDVCVHADALRRFAGVVGGSTDVAAVFGSYDDDPPATGVFSKYRNLHHHYVHQKSPGAAETFWAGCGAVRRDVFWEVGMFDEWHFWRPQIEDIELGRRIRRHGHRIQLHPEIQGTHLKRWTLRNILLTDFKGRGVPWMRLILQEGKSAGSSTLNLRMPEKLCTAFAGVGLLAVPAAILLRSPWPLLLTAGAAVAIVAFHLDFYALLRRRCGWGVLIASIPLHFLHYAGNTASTVWGWVTHIFVGAPMPPAGVAAFEELGVDKWPPVPARPKESFWYSDER